MTDFVRVIVSKPGPEGYLDGLLIGNPAATLHLLDDSNSASGIPDDWTTVNAPQMDVAGQKALVAIITNADIDVWAGYPSEEPQDERAVSVPGSLGAGTYTFYVESGQDRIFIRRSQ